MIRHYCHIARYAFYALTYVGFGAKLNQDALPG